MKDKHFISIAKNYINNVATKDEKRQVDNFYDAMQEKHKSIPVNLSFRKEIKIKNAIDSAIHKKAHPFNYKNLSIAASILLLIGITFSYSLLSINPITIKTQMGERREVLLPDSSHVFLNSNSSITYHDNFTDERHITLTGEAFFKVTRNLKKPFVISSNNTETKVLGTSFNVNATNNNKTIVSVNTGKVLVRSKVSPKNKVILTKNQQVTFLNQTPIILNNANSDDLIAWTKNIIVLNNETLENTAKILENWYNVSIEFKDEKTKQETITGKFNNETLKNVMTSIELLKDLKIDYLTPNHIIIRKNTKKN
ncbi:FecR family protein [Algibacter miyuki]|uniref:FecR family protein n=1 Tax=Algibacter miyuki TaxID=1306933 RepID=A0ABV5H4L9_9FLAO|nr:FecR family protein [Algibacter miyuki]MDN3665489.1 FecR domain-containing protein [Algibacter miyuki]